MKSGGSEFGGQEVARGNGVDGASHDVWIGDPVAPGKSESQETDRIVSVDPGAAIRAALVERCASAHGVTAPYPAEVATRGGQRGFEGAFMRWDACLAAAIAVVMATQVYLSSQASPSPDAARLASVPAPASVTSQGPIGERARRAPLQVAMEVPRGVELENFRVDLVAEFRVSARVLGAQRYFGDRLASLAPVDLALAWGEVARADKARQLDVRQVNRFYFWSFPPGATLSRDIVSQNSANVHLVPATPEIANDLMAVSKGDLIDIEGYLVDVTAADGRTWKTSRSRGDTGAGACEIILVTRVETD